MKKAFFSLLAIAILIVLSSCQGTASRNPSETATAADAAARSSAVDAYSHLPEEYREFAQKLVEAAIERTTHEVVYDPAYVKLEYPGGDVPEGKGVCTDVVIRSYRKVGVDLQKEVHEDMKKNFGRYPKIWGLKGTDKNIDHRRVPNLQTFFTRKGETLPVTDNSQDYLPGDLVTQLIAGKLPHIVIVTDVKAPGTNRYMIVHNIGGGPQLEDELFGHEITGHYRFMKELATEKE